MTFLGMVVLKDVRRLKAPVLIRMHQPLRDVYLCTLNVERSLEKSKGMNIAGSLQNKVLKLS